MKAYQCMITWCMVIIISILFPVTEVYSQDDPFEQPEESDSSLEEEMEWLRAETFVITASRVLESIKKSAASITVVTDRDIEYMGARHLGDVLQKVPGMSSWFYFDGIYKIDSRGLSKSTGQHILLMVNSHPLNENFTGGFTSLDTIMLDNVKQIEIIRGPGSALYGANAFAGVINIITKKATDIDGIRVSAQAGTYNTQQYNLLVGKSFNDVGLTLNVNYLDTEGFEASIERDNQSLTDLMLAAQGLPFPPASRAPGKTQGKEERYDISLGIEYKGLTIEGRYIDGFADRPLSVTNALTEKNEDSTTDYYLSLSYDYNIREGWDLTTKVYRNRHYSTGDYQGFPPGTVLPALPLPNGFPNFAIFPEGAFAKISNTNDRTGVELQTQYKFTETNTVVAGFTYEKMEQSGIEYSANFLYTPIQNVVQALPAVQDLSAPETNYNKDVSRTFTAGFLEDLWDINDSLRLTLGGRYDHYSDFGGSFNPRAGAVWQFMEGYDLKLLYGRAFRAPSFYELYSQNNPSFVGNPDLEPEIVDTYEVSLGADVTETLSARVTGFRNTIKDSVDLVTVEEGGFSKRVFQNKDELQTQGVDLELKYDFGRGTSLEATYTYQDGKNVDTDEPFWYNPVHKGNLQANIRVNRYLNLNTNAYFEGARERLEGDMREDPEGFALVNVTLIARNFLGELEIRGSVYNLLDEEYAIATPSESLPVDFPMPGRSFLVEARYTF